MLAEAIKNSRTLGILFFTIRIITIKEWFAVFEGKVIRRISLKSVACGKE